MDSDLISKVIMGYAPPECQGTRQKGTPLIGVTHPRTSLITAYLLIERHL